MWQSGGPSYRERKQNAETWNVLKGEKVKRLTGAGATAQSQSLDIDVDVDGSQRAQRHRQLQEPG